MRTGRDSHLNVSGRSATPYRRKCRCSCVLTLTMIICRAGLPSKKSSNSAAWQGKMEWMYWMYPGEISSRPDPFMRFRPSIFQEALMWRTPHGSEERRRWRRSPWEGSTPRSRRKPSWKRIRPIWSSWEEPSWLIRSSAIRRGRAGQRTSSTVSAATRAATTDSAI